MHLVRSTLLLPGLLSMGIAADTTQLGGKGIAQLQRRTEKNGTVPLRKEIRSLTKDELDRYYNAFKQWRDGEVPAEVSTIPNMATFVALHASSARFKDDEGIQIDRMHFGSHFLPMHGAIVAEFEKAIRYYDPSVAAHYWDWTVDPEGIFALEYLGENDANGNIVNGHLHNWPVNKVGQVPEDKKTLLGWRNATSEEDPSTPLRGPFSSPNPIDLVGRQVGIPTLERPGNKDQVSTCLTKTSFKEHWCCIFYADPEKCYPQNKEESPLHGLIHLWSGGVYPADAQDPVIDPKDLSNTVYYDGVDLASSPNDPVWFLHHSQVERIHSAWQYSVGENIATLDDPCGKYNVPNFTHVRLHGLRDSFYPSFSSTIDNPADMCSIFYRGDPLYVYDSYPDDIEAPEPSVNEDNSVADEEGPTSSGYKLLSSTLMFAFTALLNLFW